MLLKTEDKEKAIERESDLMNFLTNAEMQEEEEEDEGDFWEQEREEMEKREGVRKAGRQRTFLERQHEVEELDASHEVMRQVTLDAWLNGFGLGNLRDAEELREARQRKEDADSLREAEADDLQELEELRELRRV
jgi:hypothetical protein